MRKQKTRNLMLTMIRAVLASAVLLCVVLGAAGCQDGKKERIIDLSEAYETGLLSHDDLVTISEAYHNKRWDDTAEERMIAEYGAKRVNAVKKAEADNICNGVGAYNPYGNVSSEELHIIGYYGTYNQCVVLRIAGGDFLYPDAVTTIIIGGVRFTHTETFIRVWVKE